MSTGNKMKEAKKNCQKILSLIIFRNLYSLTLMIALIGRNLGGVCLHGIYTENLR